MKINVDFSKLQQSITLMGATPCDFEIDTMMSEPTFSAFDQSLIEGIKLKTEQIDTDDGLISANGRQVLLYIPDHDSNIDRALENGSKGKKFHVAECSKIIEMREKDAGNRYIATANLSGRFKVYGKSRKQKKEISGEVRLDVCQHCLSYLNYKGYINANNAHRKEIVQTFSLEEFFSTYSSMFEHLPREQFAHKHRGYDADFKERSRACRKRANYICQNCNVDLSRHKRLLDAHHPERIKSNSSIQDLIALCKDCHRKEPFHEHMPIKREDMELLNKLRREQGLINPTDWQSVRKFSDPALFGFLEMCESLDLPKPYVQYPITNLLPNQPGLIDLAWPNRKVGVIIGSAQKIPQWRLMAFKYAHDVLKDRDTFQNFKQFMSSIK